LRIAARLIVFFNARTPARGNDAHAPFRKME
jgi:hypothetical protein